MNVLKSTKSLFCAAGFMLTALLAGCGGGGDAGRDPILGIGGTTVVSVAVTPATASIAMGGTQQYIATASFADGSTRVVTTASAWTSGTPTVAAIGATTGLATGANGGNTVVTANYGTKSGTAALTVRPNLTAIVVTPANPTILTLTNQQFTATASFSDGTTAPITTPLTWRSTDALVAGVSATGLANGLIPGATLISATNGTVTGSTVLYVVAPLPPVVGLPGDPPPGVVVPPFVPRVVQTVELGDAANFAVLARTSLTNNSTITTIIGGDVGSPSQTVPPTLKPGFMNYVAGPELANALGALTVATTDANSRICDFESGAEIDLGGRSFTSGVYCFDGAIKITGIVDLIGPGVFIFRTKMTLDAVANAEVRLNGVAASDVFWVPVGATTLGANGIFKGSILSESSAITVGDMTNLQNGRVLSQAAVTLASNKIDK